MNLDVKRQMVLICSPFKTGTSTLHHLCKALEIPCVRAHAFWDKTVDLSKVTHILTGDRRDVEMWRLSRMFQNISDKVIAKPHIYPYAYADTKEKVLAASPEQILFHFDTYAWKPADLDEVIPGKMKNYLGLTIERHTYGIYRASSGISIYYYSADDLNDNLQNLADFLGKDIEKVKENFVSFNVGEQKWYGQLYKSTKQLILNRRNSRTKDTVE